MEIKPEGSEEGLETQPKNPEYRSYLEGNKKIPPLNVVEKVMTGLIEKLKLSKDKQKES